MKERKPSDLRYLGVKVKSYTLDESFALKGDISMSRWVDHALEMYNDYIRKTYCDEKIIVLQETRRERGEEENGMLQGENGFRGPPKQQLPTALPDLFSDNLILSMVATITTTTAVVVADGQQQQEDTATTFQSIVDGFRVQVPDGWVAQDFDNTDLILGSGLLVILCPQTETLPVLGGGYECSDEAQEKVSIVREADLQSRPEFAVLTRENKSITISDFLAYYIQFFTSYSNSTNFRLLTNIDRAVNATDPQTNQTIATAPAKYIEMSFLDSEGRPVDRDFALLVLSNDGNTGYVLSPVASLQSEAATAGEKLPPEHHFM